MTATTEATATTQVYRVYIKATPEAVWDAITRPEWSERYGYGIRSDYDLRPGGRFIGHANEGMLALGVPDVAVQGEVIECDPPHRLVQTWHLVMDPETAAEGPTRLTYEIVAAPGGVTRLTVVHDVEHAPRLALLLTGGLEDAGAGGGWAWVLSGLKTLLETGEALPR